MAFGYKRYRTLKRYRRKRKTYRTRSSKPPYRRRYKRKALATGNFYQMTRYVPYTAYSSTGVDPNSSIGSVAGNLYVNSVGYSIGSTPIDSDGYSFSSFRFYFQAGDVFNMSEYMKLFEEYKLCGITLKIRYTGNGTNPQTIGRQISGTSAQFLDANPNCYLCYRKMHRDIAIPTASGTGWQNFRDSSMVKEYRFPSRKEIKVHITPFTMQSVQASAASLSAEDNLIVRRSPWLSTGNATYTSTQGVPHYGIDIMLRADNYITNDTTNFAIIPHVFNVTAYYHFKFRYRKAGSTQL